ncbi:MAG: CPBP family intramembrane metalloprotease [Candidatus Saganbacteria bacterium]|nr:CPBP family intramembrane metalloprotease [Candidatus Saganbacteria bacterium]
MKYRPWVFIVAVLLFSWLVQIVLFTGMLPANLLILYMFAPALTAFIFFVLFKTPWREQLDLFIRRIDLWSIVFAFFYPFFWLSLVLLVAVLTGLGQFNASFLSKALAWPFISSFLMLVVFAFPTMWGEEYGWRGYLLPGLVERYGKLNATLILGLVWGCWHIPSYYILYSQAGLGQPVLLTITGILTVAVGAFPYTYLFYRTRNIIPCVLLHAAYDLASGHIFFGTPAIPGFTDGTPGLVMMPWPTAMMLLIVTGAVLAGGFVFLFGKEAKGT